MKFIIYLTLAICLIYLFLTPILASNLKKAHSHKSHKSKNKGSQIFFYRRYVTRYSSLCRLYVDDPYGCIAVSYCGWCQLRRTCVPGSFYGPLYSRLCPETDYYVYETPVTVRGITWDPWATTVQLRWNTSYRKYYVLPYRTTVTYS